VELGGADPFAPDITKYENDHRTVYMMVQRSVKHPYLTLFDGADGERQHGAGPEDAVAGTLLHERQLAKR